VDEVLQKEIHDHIIGKDEKEIKKIIKEQIYGKE